MITSFDTNSDNQMEWEEVMSWERKGRLVLIVTLSWKWNPVHNLETQPQ